MCNHPKSPTKIFVCVFHPDMNMGFMQFNSSKMFYLSFCSYIFNSVQAFLLCVYSLEGHGRESTSHNTLEQEHGKQHPPV